MRPYCLGRSTLRIRFRGRRQPAGVAIQSAGITAAEELIAGSDVRADGLGFSIVAGTAA
jgi:hypothetical protein